MNVKSTAIRAITRVSQNYPPTSSSLSSLPTIDSRYYVTLPSSPVSLPRRHTIYPGDNDLPRISHRQFSDSVAENQIKAWLNRGGDESLQNKGKSLPIDRHKDAAMSLAVNKNDYIHSKILADNNIKPDSIERRIALDKAWSALKDDIREAYKKFKNNNTSSSLPADKDDHNVEIFAMSETTRQMFDNRMDNLNKQAKKVNDAIISDSLRFNGRSPVRHARLFIWEERIREALCDEEK